MDSKKALKTLNVRSVWLPVIIGFGIVITLILTDDRINGNSLILIKDLPPLILVMSLVVLATKDITNMLRLRTTNSGLQWGSVLRVVLLWEFAIAVTPPVIGATAVLVFIMFKEGLSFGKALSITLLLATLDNLFFLTASPLVVWYYGEQVFPDDVATLELLGKGLKPLFWFSYGLIVIYTSFMLSSILLFPKTIRKLTMRVMTISWLNRWQPLVLRQTDDLVLVSKELKGRKWPFWISLLCITYLVWILKFSVLNVLMSGFVEITIADHSLILARHLIMWVVMLVSPAPGNAGTAEVIFPAFFEQYLGEYTFVTTLAWRLLSFYPYLIIGVLVLPKWLKRK